MTIFLVGDVAFTAANLDPKRLNRQIQECYWLINMVEGTGKWKNHPCNFMYKDHIDWVKKYKDCLLAFKNNDYDKCVELSNEAEAIKPDLICDDLFLNFKKRLYEKDPVFYKKWSHLGGTTANYYFVYGHWWKYENGKKEILLALRKNTRYNDGEYELPGGHVDEGEDLMNAMIRETKEKYFFNCCVLCRSIWT